MTEDNTISISDLRVLAAQGNRYFNDELAAARNGEHEAWKDSPLQVQGKETGMSRGGGDEGRIAIADAKKLFQTGQLRFNDASYIAPTVSRILHNHRINKDDLQPQEL